MYLLLGKLRMESRDCEDVMQSFERARARMQPHPSPALSVVSLVSLLTAKHIEKTFDL
jgi:hypothetical protein